MTDAVRVGVAGVGRLGGEHARILSRLPGAELSGVHDRDRDRGTRIARRSGSRHTDTLADLFRISDAVVVAVPTSEHRRVAGEALASGCHVLVEKPLARSLEEADELIERAGSADLVLAVGHVERFNAAVRDARPHLERPRFLESLRLAPFRPRGTDVTVVLDLMIHDIDLVLGLVESPLSSLHAVGTPVLTDRVDIANARLIFEDGAVAEITASRVSEEPTRVLRAFQRSGYLRLDLAAGEGEFLRRRPGRGPSAAGPGAMTGLDDLVERIPLRGDDREPLRLELEAFLDAVRGRPSRVVTAREGREALDVALRITREIEHFNDVALETA